MNSNQFKYSVPEEIEPEIAELLEDGIMKVQPPTLSKSKLGDKSKTPLAQIWCHSPRVRNNSLGLCNHSVGAIFEDVKGHAIFSQLWECPKCRTAYAMTLEVGAKDDPIKILSAKVVNLNRGVQMFVDANLDLEKDTWIVVHEKKS